MNGYRIVFKEPNVADIESFAVRKPNNDEIVVKVEKTLISNGTEKSILRGDVHTGGKFPRVPGYSSVGRVVKVGAGVKEYKVGDRVFVARGGHASYNIRPVSWCAKIPDNVSYDDAVFTRMYGFSLLAIRRSRFEMGESVAVVGLGQLGLFATQLAHIAGALPVVAVGNREIRREKAYEFGADYVYAPDDPDLKDKIISNTKITGSGGADIIIETSGNMAGLATAMKYAANRARIVISGCYWQDSTNPIDFYKINLMGYEVIGAHDRVRQSYNSAPYNWTRKKDFMAILGWMNNKSITPSVIEPVYESPENASKVYDRLLNDREFPLGVIFDWTKI